MTDASAVQTGLSQQAAEPEVSALAGFDPSRWSLRPITHGGGLHRGWQVLLDGAPCSGLFDKPTDATSALVEFRAEGGSR